MINILIKSIILLTVMFRLDSVNANNHKRSQDNMAIPLTDIEQFLAKYRQTSQERKPHFINHNQHHHSELQSALAHGMIKYQRELELIQDKESRDKITNLHIKHYNPNYVGVQQGKVHGKKECDHNQETVCPFHHVEIYRPNLFPFVRMHAQCNCVNKKGSCLAITEHDIRDYQMRINDLKTHGVPQAEEHKTTTTSNTYEDLLNIFTDREHSLSGCRQVFTYMPVLERKEWGEWTFAVEEVPTSCSCLTYVNNI
jgi:hypothetical protein